MRKLFAVLFSVLMLLGAIGPSASSAVAAAPPVVQEVQPSIIGPIRGKAETFSVSGCTVTAYAWRSSPTNVAVQASAYCPHGHQHTLISWVQKSGGGYAQRSSTTTATNIYSTAVVYGNYGYFIYGGDLCHGTSGCKFFQTARWI